MPVRIYDIAKKLGIENKEVLTKAKELGIAAARVPSSSPDKITAEYLESHLGPPRIATPAPAPAAPEPIVLVKAPEPPPPERAAGPALDNRVRAPVLPPRSRVRRPLNPSSLLRPAPKSLPSSRPSSSAIWPRN